MIIFKFKSSLLRMSLNFVKVAIASQYLVPKALKDAGLSPPIFDVNITDDALDVLVKNYCRESGVRSLEKHIEKIARKIAYAVVHEQETTQETTTSGADIDNSSGTVMSNPTHLSS